MRLLVLAVVLLTSPVCLAGAEPLVPKPLPAELEFDDIWAQLEDPCEFNRLRTAYGRVGVTLVISGDGRFDRGRQREFRALLSEPAVADWLGKNAICRVIKADEMKEVCGERVPGGYTNLMVVHSRRTQSFADSGMSTPLLLQLLETTQRGVAWRDAIDERMALFRADPDMADEDFDDLFRDAMSADRFEDALELILWRWEHRPRENRAGPMRLPGPPYEWQVIATNMAWTIREHPDARKQIEPLQADAERRVTRPGRKRLSDLYEWMALNTAIDEEERTIDWFLSGAGDGLPLQEKQQIAMRVEFLLIEQERWRDLGEAVGDPVQRLRFYDTIETMTDPVTRVMLGEDPVNDAQRTEFRATWKRQKIAEFYAGVLAAGKHDAARELVAYAVERDDSPETRVVLIEYAIKSGVPTKDALELMDQVEEAGHEAGDLRERLEAALGIGERG